MGPGELLYSLPPCCQLWRKVEHSSSLRALDCCWWYDDDDDDDDDVSCCNIAIFDIDQRHEIYLMRHDDTINRDTYVRRMLQYCHTVACHQKCKQTEQNPLKQRFLK